MNWAWPPARSSGITASRATPAMWLAQARVRRAQHLLETSDLPVERIAGEVGFGSPTVLRERFGRLVGTSPQAYRRAFRRA